MRNRKPNGVKPEGCNFNGHGDSCGHDGCTGRDLELGRGDAMSDY